MDLDNISFSTLPKQWAVSLIKAFSGNYHWRTRKIFMLNTSWGCRMMWNIINVFIDEVVKSKIKLASENTNEELVKMVHLEQLQEKYRGEAHDVEMFWPPYSPSDKFGVDPFKIREEDTANNLQMPSYVGIDSRKFMNKKSYHNLEFITPRASSLVNDKTTEINDDSLWLPIPKLSCNGEWYCIIF